VLIRESPAFPRGGTIILRRNNIRGITLPPACTINLTLISSPSSLRLTLSDPEHPLRLGHRHRHWPCTSNPRATPIHTTRNAFRLGSDDLCSSYKRRCPAFPRCPFSILARLAPPLPHPRGLEKTNANLSSLLSQGASTTVVGDKMYLFVRFYFILPRLAHIYTDIHRPLYREAVSYRYAKWWRTCTNSISKRTFGPRSSHRRIRTFPAPVIFTVQMLVRILFWTQIFHASISRGQTPLTSLEITASMIPIRDPF
jgi:hypothetical protein